METEVARSEIEFFVIGRVIGDVHLAVFPRDGAVGLKHHRRVVIKPSGTAFEERRDKHHVVLLGQCSEELG